MLEALRNELNECKNTSPWRRRVSKRSSELWEGIGAPEPGEYRNWKNRIRTLKRKIKKATEEDARKQINRP